MPTGGANFFSDRKSEDATLMIAKLTVELQNVQSQGDEALCIP